LTRKGENSMSLILYEDPKLAAIDSKLKKARICRGYTQESPAELSGVNIKSIAAYEQNPSKLTSASVNTVLKLCDSLGVDLEDIINPETVNLESKKES
jgi:DNA-binding XRE family transcriptional regulator